MDSFFLLTAASGASAHILLYRFGEWDVEAPSLVAKYFILFVIFIGIEKFNVVNEYKSVISLPPGWSAKLVGYHILGIYLSMIIYRIVWHRLARYPGPFFAKLSNFYVTLLSAKGLHLYEEVEKLHKQYGDYVRLGPSELSINDPEAVRHIYSSQAKVGKGVWYTVLEPRVSVHMERNKQEHARRRKVWDQAFSSKALRDYEPRVSRYTNQLLSVIQQNSGNPIDVSRLFNYFSFDVMGDLAFGKSFNMLIDGRDDYFLKQLHADMGSIGYFSHLTWLFPFFKRIPVLNADYLRFWKWVGDRVQERIKNTPSRADIFTWLLDDFEKKPKTKRSQLDLDGDAYLIVVAGSDTTAAIMTSLFFQLATDPQWQTKIQQELNTLSELTNDQLLGIKLLDALIYETLRLHPAVPSGTQRMTPPEGITIGDQYIPGDVMVCIPSHTMFRDERVFTRPLEFIPERWTTKSELIKEPSAFIPFNGGPYVCVGKQLALMELRRVTAEILTRYNVALAPGQTVSGFLNGKRDAFTLVTPPLQLLFRERKKGNK
ncbi:putative cytochrome P450 oxidoreductase [Talaromyces proteolyticus]|uniref:Cytochrome P450 oxidoreductase n=1 Tax=Talaromyces proteolyticus TaxID=1131652 RepID=A0AAD4KF48_9EURO|nr:putative cytochrome P450 oxidoreductase [Talaromyces proteolyticus]KAH8690164.1 putative cytochrome P450 oxidoreductase [Talaromyces proteolyticus]